LWAPAVPADPPPSLAIYPRRSMPRTPQKYRVPIDPAYVEELRARCEQAGLTDVAKAAGVARSTLWRQMTGGSDHNQNPDGIERIRHALAKVERRPLMPPPLVGVRGQAHHAWIRLADDLDPQELETLVGDPAAALAALRKALGKAKKKS
jgi:transcriptional regulator with XRE-family HTH domain